MAEFFGKGISVGSGFDLGANLPLDNRTVQATIADRDAMPTIQLVEGLLVYVKENKTTYVLTSFNTDGTNRVWTKLATGTVVEVINSLESESTTAALSAAQGKALNTLITELKNSVSAALNYKGSKATYADLPTTGNKKGDVWNVVAAYGTTPAGTNYAWDGSQWDPLGGTVDLSGYYSKTQVDDAISAAKTDLEAADTALDGKITTVTNQLANKVDKVEGSGLITDTALNQITTNKTNIESLQVEVSNKQDVLDAALPIKKEGTTISLVLDPAAGDFLSINGPEGLTFNIDGVKGTNVKLGTAITSVSGDIKVTADKTIVAGLQTIATDFYNLNDVAIVAINSPDLSIRSSAPQGGAINLSVDMEQLVSSSSAIKVIDNKIDLVWEEIE
uniref:Tail fiber protein n=1 Tax=CrAss-like virus sp. ctYsL76 TaxID=2826826 RepID=A0A8S5QMM3_9CAUD|nr:MAG TPA: hypothetical protein [CrAss-like virus sp. ctYsL76]